MLRSVQVCRQNGYFPVVDMEHYTDLWAFCVLRVAIRNNNTGDSDNILYDHPLGWWDTEWPGGPARLTLALHDAPGIKAARDTPASAHMMYACNAGLACRDPV